MDSEDKFAIAALAIGCATVLGLTGLIASCCSEINAATETDEKTMQDVSPAIEHANGCPLDAVAYDAPKFARDGSDVFKVTDRFSGQSWWLVWMDGEWVVLPIESKETANVG